MSHQYKTLARGALLVALGLLAGTAAHADLIVGDYRGAASTDVGPLLRFGDYQQGNVAPQSLLFTNGMSERMNTPFAITYEPIENVLYVSDYFGQAIRVYPASAAGNVPASRILNPPLIGQPRQLAIDVLHDELIVIASSCCVYAYPRTATGNAVNRIRSINWGGGSGSLTRLNNPDGLIYLPATDEIVVADLTQTSPSTSSGVLLFFARTANPSDAPTRAIEGPLTLLGDGVSALAFDVRRNQIIAIAYDASSTRIVSFPAAGSGNIAPLRDIEGSATGLSSDSRLAYDPSDDTLIVSNGSSANVAFFARMGNGNIAPQRALSGNLTTLVAPAGLALIPGERIFRNTFE